MEKPDSQIRFNPQQLGRLLGVYQETDPVDDPNSGDASRERLLRECLSDVPQLGPDVVDKLPALIRHMVQELPRLAGVPLGELLADTHTPVEDLRIIKNQAKAALSDSSDHVAYEVAGVIYYAAISAAVAYHHQTISTHSYRQLRDSLEDLQGKPWITPAILALFRQAQAACQAMVERHP